MDEIRDQKQHETGGQAALLMGHDGTGKQTPVPPEKPEDAAVQGRREAESEVRKRLTPQEMEARAFAAFLDRAKAFLAADPYWMHVLTMPGGRAKRKRVASEFSKLMTTIPHFNENGPFNRELRRKLKI